MLVLLILQETRGSDYAALGVFMAGAATDGLDGYLARRYASATATGQWLDPLADKVLVITPLITLTVLGRFPSWAAIVILVREIGVSFLRFVMGRRGAPMPASPAAKVKTTVQLFAIMLYLLPLPADAGRIRLAAAAAAVALTVATGMQYAATVTRRLRAGQRVRERAPLP